MWTFSKFFFCTEGSLSGLCPVVGVGRILMKSFPGRKLLKLNLNKKQLGKSSFYPFKWERGIKKERRPTSYFFWSALQTNHQTKHEWFSFSFSPEDCNQLFFCLISTKVVFHRNQFLMKENIIAWGSFLSHGVWENFNVEYRQNNKIFRTFLHFRPIMIYLLMVQKSWKIFGKDPSTDEKFIWKF